MTDLIGRTGCRRVGTVRRIRAACEIAFIDATVADASVLRSHLRPGVEGALLAPGESGTALAAIARRLAGRRNLQIVHLVAHGAPGALHVAADILSLETIARDRPHLAAIGRALAPDGTLCLWACNVGQGPSGRAFVAALARATGASVAASTTLVGAAALGGAWDLDGHGAGRPPLTAHGIAAYAGVLDTTNATTGTDTPTLTAGDDTVVVTNTNQIQPADKFDGLDGLDAIQIGTAGAGISVNLSAAASDGVNGFLNMEAITFVNTSTTSTATFSGAQFGAGKISTSVAVTGTASLQALAITVPAGTGFDMSGWTFAGWTSGADTITVTGSTGSETIVGSSQNDIFVVSNTNQVSATDRYDGGGGTDTLQIGTAAAGTAIDLSAAATDGVDGFLNIEALSFVNTSGTSTATFSSAQFGAGKISTSLAVTGNAQTQAIAVNLVADGSFDLSAWTFTTWTSGTDTITITGSTGSETITGSSQIDRFVVGDTNQISASDKYDGGTGNDILQVGVAGAGTSIDLSGAATVTNGFVSIEALTFVNTSGTQTATFNSAQFGAGRISTSVAVTGTSSNQAIVVNMAAGGALDMSAWTFATWGTGTDSITVTGTASNETITGTIQAASIDAGDGDDTLIVTATTQVQAADKYDGGIGTDTLQIGAAAAGISVDISAAASDGVNGFINLEAISFVNTTGTSNLTLSSGQLGAGKIATPLTVTGTSSAQALFINMVADTSLDISGWTFNTWTTADLTTFTGSTGTEVITGSSNVDRFVVSNTNQVAVGDRYDGAGGTDTLMIGVAGAGITVDLSAASSDGVNGFLNLEGIAYTNTSGTSSATFSSAQFGAGRISASVAVTGTSSNQTLAVNLVSGATFDMSAWTFATWGTGTDAINVTGTSGNEIITGATQAASIDAGDGDDTLIVTATGQIQAGDKYDGGVGTDTLQIGVAGVGTSIDLSSAANNGVNGFLNIEAITFTNTSGTSTATFNAAQFGAGKISTTVAVTGNGSTQAFVLNLTAGGSLDMSGWTFAGWTSGTDAITITGSTGSETLVGSSQDDIFVVSNTNQVSATDRYDGGGGTDKLQIGTVGAGVTVDLSAAATDGVNGFLNVEALTFVNTSGTSTATFSSAQFGAGKIATPLTVTGTGSTTALVFNLVADGSLDLSAWTFNTWTSGTDTITITGSTGNEVVTGSSNIDRFVVSNTNQVSATDRYDGGAGNDILQIGVAGAGNSIDLSAAATDGVNGFLSVEAITYVNTSGTSTATFSSAQFSAGRISNSVTVTGTSSTTAIAVNVVSGGVFDISAWTFTTWTVGTDTIAITGAGGSETITGTTATASIDAGAGDDILIVASSAQVQVGDRYDGGADTDTLQIGVGGAGTAIDLSIAANDGVNGFLNIEAITFTNTSLTQTATFNAAQFGAGKISTTVAVTGTASAQAFALNLSAGGALDLSGWTFAGWTSGTDTITITGSTGNETIVGSSQNDIFVVSNTNQVSATDRYDGGGGTDTLQIGTAAAGTAIDLSAAATDGVDGFLSIEALTFVNTSGTSTASFGSAQFGAGRIATSLAVTGNAQAQAIAVNLVADGSLDLSALTFTTWTSGTDTITITGSTGSETITGSSQIDRFVVSDTSQISAADKYDGGAGNDILQVGVAGAGTSIDLSGAATVTNGFVSIEALTFVNTSGTQTATLNSAQFGAGRISTSVAVTGTSSNQAIVVSMTAGGALDMSAWTFATWGTGTDSITVAGTASNETITGATQVASIDAGDGDDTLIVTATGQVQAGDKYDGGIGTDTLQIGAAAGGISVDLSAAATDGVNGFLNLEALTFVNTTGTTNLTATSAQFGAGKISTSLSVTGTSAAQALFLNLVADGTLDLSGWTFTTWNTADLITITGSTGTETITGSGQNERFVVANTGQVNGGDRYDGAGGTDTLVIGVVGVGTSIDLSAAASDGVNGFLSIEAITYTNTSGTSTATFSSAQFGAGRISSTATVTGTTVTTAFVVNVVSDTAFDLSTFTFATWTAGTDTITVTGAGGAETLTGATATASIDAGLGDDTLIVASSGQVQVGDKYDGGGGTDTLQVGTGGAGTGIDLSSAANNGVNGFLNIEAITFTNSSATQTATFNAAQFGAGRISTTVAVTGTSATQAFVLNLTAGGALDMSGWTFAGWTSGTDTIAITGSTGAETLVGSSQNDIFVVSNTNQVSATDRYDGGGGTDTLQIGVAGAGTSIDFSAAATDGVDGFLNIEALTFTNTSGTSTATFSSAQFGAGRISSTVSVTGTSSTTALALNLAAGGSLDLSVWTFTTWTSGADTITVTGSTGTESIVGTGFNETYVVSSTSQVAAGDKTDAGGGTDTLQIGVAGVGTSIDLSAAATDGVNGFLNFEAITFTNTSGTSTATFSSGQFGAGKISGSVTVTGTSSITAFVVNVVSGSAFDISTFTFATWTVGTDTITIAGAGGSETITGSTATVAIDGGLGDDTLIVASTTQVQAGDRYDGGGGTDTLQIGLVGAGTSIDLSVAASDGVNGFLNLEALAFINSSGTSTATFNAAQFGAGKLSTTLAVTGTASTQALVLNLSAGGALDLSGWTFSGWTSGTDTITITGSTGAETLVGSSQNDVFVVSNTNQVAVSDRYDGGGGTDTLQIGTVGAGVTVDLSAAATDGVNGFLNIEALSFVNTSTTTTATFTSAQFGGGRIATSLAVTGTTSNQAIAVNLVADGSLDLSAWTFTTWTSGTDTITIAGSTGSETITGSSQIDRFVVSDTSQISAADKYDGGAGNDILQVGVAGAGTSIDLSGAATVTNGFVSIEALTFVNTSGTQTATFNSAQFGAGRISASVAVTGTISNQALVVNMAAGGALDMSAWTFATWGTGTDSITVAGTASNETITGATQAASIDAGDGDDTLIVTATGQVQAGDKYDGGIGTDTLQIGPVGSVDLSAAAADGVNGFLNLEALTFVNTTGTTNLTASSAQFGAGKISTSLSVTGTSAAQALFLNLVADGTLDLSGWTFTTWNTADLITITGSTGTETITGSGQNERFVVANTGQVNGGDRYDGAGGTDTLVIGVVGVGTSIDLSAAASDGVNGFLGIEAITYTNTSGTSTATFSSAQFGAGRISNTVAVTGSAATTAIVVNVVSDTTFDMSGWTFATWTPGTDTVTVTGAGGAETLTGSTATASIDAGGGDDTLIVTATGQVQVGDKYDGGGGTDTLQIGVTGVGTSIDLSAAANNGINGFLNIEALAFVNTSGTSTATFNAAQFGAGKVSTTLAVTGTSSNQALAINLSAAGSLDMSGWTFTGWTSGTDTITVTGSTGAETIVGSTQNDIFVVSNTNQVLLGDRYDGRAGTDTLQIGTVGAGVTVDLSVAATDGVDGFLDIEALSFVNNAGTSTATLSSAQLGAGKISTVLSVVGTAFANALALNLVADGALDLSGWSFNTWTSGTDTITITGSTGTEVITGSSQIDRFVVGNTGQVSAGDRYDGGAGNDILQVGLAGLGTSVDLSAAATDGVNGFLGIEAITYVNTSGTASATFSSAQFGTGRIASTVAVTGTAFTTAIVVNVATDTAFDISGWTFNTWTAGTDTITIAGAGGAETITGTTATATIDAGGGDDTLIVTSTGQVQVGDRYDGGGGTDTLQIGVVGAGTSIDLSVAANDGVNGFVNLEAIAFVNNSGTQTATFNAAQFGAGKIANATAVTGTASTQAFVINLSAGGSLDLSGWTFSGWTSGTDTITVTGSTGNETIIGSSQIDRFVVGGTSQVSAGDRYDGGADNDILQIGLAGAGSSIDFSGAASDGVDGFVNIDALTFVNTSGTQTATFSSAQFGAGKISNSTLVTGVTQTQAIVINLVADGALDLSGWTFSGWTSGTDTITVTGSTGTESIVGSSQIDRFIVGDTNQVQAADKVDGGGGNDILQVGVAGAGTSIDLSGAAADGVDGFLSLEAIAFVNTSGTQTATFSSAQFGAGRIANSVAITGNAQAQAIVVDVVSGGTFDMSAWTFNTWADTITVTGTGGSEAIAGATQAAAIDAGDGDDALIVSNTNQVQAGDTYDGGIGTDTLQIGTVGAGVAVNLSGAASDGVNGFLNLEALTFVNTSGTSTATFSSAQFGAGKIATALAVTGTASVQGIVVNLVADTSLDLSGWTFSSWTGGTDTITIAGSTGSEIITGSGQIDRFVVGNTSQIAASDRYDGAAGNDILQVGVAGAGTSIDLSGAASDGVDGFVSIEAIAFANTSGTATATFSSAQFGSGRISSSVAVTGTTSTTAIVVNVASGSVFDISGWTLATWTSGTDTLTLTGAAGAETIIGSSQIDLIVGAAGADTLTGGGGLDVFGFAAGDSVLSFGGAGTSGTVAGYDIVTDFKVATTAGASEKIGFAGVTVAGDAAGATGVASTLLLHTGLAVQTHSITGGLITFDATALSTTGDLAAVAQYLQGTDLGGIGASVAFQATIGGLARTFVWIQGAAAPDSTSVLVDLVNVSASGLSAAGGLISVLDTVAPAAPSITAIAESGAGGINAAEASDGTIVDVNLASTGALAGDTLKVSWGGQNVSYTLTSLDIAAGSVALAVSQAKINAQGDGTFDVTAALTDAVGNAGVASAAFSVIVDRVTPGAPTIDSIGENAGGGISAAEASDGVLVVVGLGATGALAGDTVTVGWGSQSVGYTLLAADILAGSASVTVPLGTITAQGEGTFNVSAKVTDIAGNVGADSPAAPVYVDTVVPGAPSVQSIGENAGGGINAAEASDGTLVVIGLAGTGAVAGDVVTVAWGGQNVGYALLAADILAGNATMIIAPGTITAQGDGPFNVTATVTDSVGNVSPVSSSFAVTVDTVTPGAPTITSIAEDAAGGINAAEAADGTPVVVNLSGTGALAGDKLAVAWGAETVVYTLLAADILAGSASVTVSPAKIAAQGDGTVNVTAQLTDIAGNTGGASSAVSATVDTVLPGAPTITAVPEDSAGGINTSEAADGTPVIVSLAGTGALAGDKLTVAWGAQSVVYALLAADILGGSATVTISSGTIATQGEGTFNVTAKLTDLAGNVGASSAAVPVTVDTVPPGAPAITSIAENGAGGINAAEAADGTLVVVSLLGTGALAGDTLKIHWGGETVAYILQAGDILAGNATVAISSATIAAQGDGIFSATAQVTDIALTTGPSSPAVSVTVDTVTPGAPAITSISENASGGINAVEASNGTPVIVSLAGTGAVAGDTLTVTWGGQAVDYTLLAVDVIGGSATVTIPSGTIATQGNGLFNVTAKLTDIAGNASGASSSVAVTVDTVSPGVPSVKSIGENGAGGINAAEAADGTLVVVNVSGIGALAGDTLTLAWGGQAVTHTLLAADILAGSATVTVPAGTIGTQGDGTFNVTAKVTDGAGNSSATSSNFVVMVDTVTPGILTISSIAEDSAGGINASEAANGTSVVVTLAGTGALAGDIVTVAWGTETVTYTLLAGDIVTGSATVTVPLGTITAQGDGTVSVTAKLTDVAGNVGVSSAGVPVTVDTVTPPAPAILPVAENAAGGINAAEAADGTSVVVDLFGTGAVAGDIVTVSWGAETVTYTLVAADILGGSASVTVSAATISTQGDGMVSVAARVTDIAGNVSAVSPARSVIVDMTAPDAPAIIAVAENDAGGISAAEVSGGTPVVVGLTGTGAVAGDLLTLNWGGQSVVVTLGAGDITAGSVTVTVPLSTIAAQGDGTLGVTAQVTDAAGNTGASAPALSVTVDTVAPGAPTVQSIVENDFGGIDAGEAMNGTPVVISLAGTGALAGDTVTLLWGQQSIDTVLGAGDVVAGSVTVSVSAAILGAQGDGTFSVTALLIDGLGNSRFDSAAFVVTVDTAAPVSPSVKAIPEADTDGSLNAVEASDGTVVVVSLAATGAATGDTLTVTWGQQAVSYTLLAADIASGSATVIVPAPVIAAQGDGLFSVSTKVTDAAGNTSFSLFGRAVTVDTAAPSAPSVQSIAEHGGGGINALEAADGTPVVVSLAGTGAAAGDTIVVGWGAGTAAYTLLAADILAGTATVQVAATTIATVGDGTVDVTAKLVDAAGNQSANAPALAATVDTAAPAAPTIESVGKNGNGSIGQNEASNGTFVVVGIAGTGALAGDTLTLAWGGQTDVYALTAADIVAGKATVLVPSTTIAAEGDGTVSVTAKVTDAAGNVSSSAPASAVSVGNGVTATVSIAALDAIKVEGGAVTAFTFTVALDHAATGAQTVNWIATGSGLHPADIGDFDAPPAGTVTFAAGENSKTVTVMISGDSQVELDEGFTVALSTPSAGLTIGTATASGTILNDDKATVSIAGLASEQAEGDTGARLLTFVVSLDQASATDQAVIWTVTGAGSHPADGDDLGGILPAGLLNFDAGETSKTVSIAVSGDTLQEFDEGFVVTLSLASPGLILGTASAGGTIRDDDRPVVSIAAVQASQPEGISFTFTLTLDQAALVDQTVDWSVAGTGPHAANALDFGGTLPGGTVTFAAGETSKTVVIAASADSQVEFDETFTVTLSNASDGLALGTALAAATIANDDVAAVSITALSADKAEGEGATTPFTFEVNLDRPAVPGQTVLWTVSGSGAQPANAVDFAGGMPSGTIIFAAGETSKVVTVLVAGDSQAELDEGFTVTLSNASAGLAVGTALAAGTIRADEHAMVSISATSAVQLEGNTYLFAVTLEQAAATLQTVAWSASGSGAHAADLADFAGTFPSGTVTFLAGEISKSILVSVSADTTVESDETFTVALSNASPGLALGTALAAATIVNDDVALVSIAAQSAVEREGNGGTTPFTFTVTLDRASDAAQAVTWSVIAADPADFGGVLPAGTVVFAAGETSRTVTVNVAGDTILEPDESFTVSLSNASPGLAISVASAAATVVNDDASVSIAVLFPNLVEGSDFTFTLTRTGDLSTAQTVAYTVSGSAAASDFAGGLLPSGTVTFAVGETSRTIVVAVAADADVEADETFALSLSAPSDGLTVATATASATIVNDDTTVSITALSGAQPEGTPSAFTLTRTGDLSGVQSVTWSVAGFGADPANGADFAGGALPSRTVTFASGEASKTVVIDVAGDTSVEADETFQVTLSNASSGLAIAVGTATATVVNDDASVAIAALAASQNEGNTGAATALTFTLTLAGDSSVARSVSYAVTGTGVSPASAGDFVGGVLPSGTVTFAADETSKTLVVQVAGDASSEPNETFSVTLSAPSNGLTIATGSAVGTIVNDDSSGGDPVLGAVVANDDVYTGIQGQAIHVAVVDGLLFNDGGTRPLTVSVLTRPAHGTLSLAADGSFDYVPDAGFAGADSFTYRVAGTTGADEGIVSLQIAPVSTGPMTTLNLLSLSVEQQIAAVYTAFFSRGADDGGFEFWVSNFTLGLTTQTGATLLSNIASSFAISDEAQALYPFLRAPQQASDADINAFLDTVYDNLFARSFDAAGLDYWSNQVKQHLAAGEFVGGVLIDIMNGAQNSAAGQDITTLMGKVTVNLEYVHDQQLLGTTWTHADDGAEAKALIQSVTSDPATVLTGIAQAKALVMADVN